MEWFEEHHVREWLSHAGGVVRRACGVPGKVL
jgi:hypothetical protein